MNRTNKKRILKIERLYTLLISYLVRFRKFFIVFIILLFGLPIFYLPHQIENWDSYNETIGSDYYQEEIRPLIDKWLGGSLRLFVREVFEKSDYRTPKQTVLHINAEMDHGHTLSQMNLIISKMETFLQTQSGVDLFITNIRSAQYAHIEIYFTKENEEGNLPYQLKSRLIDLSLNYGGIEWDIYGVGKGFRNDNGESLPKFKVELRGYNYLEVGRQAQILASKLLKHPRIQEVNTNEKLNYWEKESGRYVLRFHKGIKFMHPANLSELIKAVELRVKPRYADCHLIMDNILTPVFLIEKESDQFSVHELMNDPFSATKISSLAAMKFEKTTNSIKKENRMYIRHLSFDYLGSQHFGEQYLDSKLKELTAEMPSGYSVEKKTFNWNYDQIKRQYSLILLLIIIIYFICAVLFENLRQPLLIIATIPVSFIGLFLIFPLFDLYFDQGGYAAFLLLGGLVVNASIFVMSEFKYSRQKKSPNNRLVRAIGNKSRPIVLTITSTILGLSPFLLEGQDEVFWFSLAIGTIGGLMFSFFALFIFLPVMMWQKTSQNTIRKKTDPVI